MKNTSWEFGVLYPNHCNLRNIPPAWRIFYSEWFQFYLASFICISLKFSIQTYPVLVTNPTNAKTMASVITNPYRFFRKHTADLIPIFWSEILPIITWKVSISTAEIETDEANLFSNIIYLRNQLVMYCPVSFTEIFEKFNEQFYMW